MRGLGGGNFTFTACPRLRRWVLSQSGFSLSHHEAIQIFEMGGDRAFLFLSCFGTRLEITVGEWDVFTEPFWLMIPPHSDQEGVRLPFDERAVSLIILLPAEATVAAYTVRAR